MFCTSCCLAFVFCWTVSDLIVSLRAYKCELYDCLDRLSSFLALITNTRHNTLFITLNLISRGSATQTIAISSATRMRLQRKRDIMECRFKRQLFPVARHRYRTHSWTAPAVIYHDISSPRSAVHVFIQIYFRMHHFVVKFSKFSSPQAARGH